LSPYEHRLIVIGFAIGAAAVVAPMFISEMAPPAMRGALISFDQLAITIGILEAFLHADRRNLCLSTLIVRTARCAYDKGGWQDNVAWWVIGRRNTLEQPLRRRYTHLIWRYRDRSERRIPERRIDNVIKPNYRKVLPRHEAMGLQT
jgi:hypothetical protein